MVRNVNLIPAAREVARRVRVAFDHGRERVALDRLSRELARLNIEYGALSSEELLHHFRTRTPQFFAGFENPFSTAHLQQRLFPTETEQLIKSANAIQHSQSVGFAEWRRDPLSDHIWPLEYHADLALQRNDGSDVRTLWELNRLSHFNTFSRAYAVTRDVKYASTLFAHFDSWIEQNPLGLGPNWSSAMEVSLRAMNLLAAFTVCRHAESFTVDRLLRWLQLLEQHGAHIKRNLEFTHLGTSNHYLTNVVGLLWLGITLPELSAAEEWRNWSLQQLSLEMDKQVLPDGSDYEGSTGYHRYVLELFLYSFILCRERGIVIAPRYWQKLESMLQFLRCYLRPDGSAPLIGDSDGSQVLPIRPHRADDHGYLLPVGALATNNPQINDRGINEELLWLCGEEGASRSESHSTSTQEICSTTFPDAGIYVMRHEDLYLLFNAARHLRKGRSSHRHNDALSIEVSVCGRPFIVDPGTYTYSADPQARHLFRSTTYHSTIQVDDAEQNSIEVSQPFLFGNEARPAVTYWDSTDESDRVTGFHVGYQRLAGRLRHLRTITLYKRDRWWLVQDQIEGRGRHKISARFHLADGLDVNQTHKSATVFDPVSQVRLLMVAFDCDQQPECESQFVSHHYGSREPSTIVTWTANVKLPCSLRWALVPICVGEDEQERRLAVARDLANEVN